MTRSLNILYGVSGGIAAVKAPDVVRRFRERGHRVRCIMTRNADSFVAPLALEVLSGQPIYREQYLKPNESCAELHVEAATWADVFCIAPATCNTLARLALGLADDFLTTTALVFDGTMIVAPAMNGEMWAKAIVQENLQRLIDRGVRAVGPTSGALANGEIGMGRMVEALEILAAVEDASQPRDLEGLSVLVSAGPTRESIDRVRFLSNRSSGKMGFNLATEAAARGARVNLVAGPVALPTPARVDRIDVTTALEMEQAVQSLAPGSDLIIMTAAVADFRPASIASYKLKKSQGPPKLDLVENPDILAGLADLAPQAIRVGFAAETGDLESEAIRKLSQKRAHFMVANDVSRDDIGFGSSDNEVIVYRQGEVPRVLNRQNKQRIAGQLLDLFAEALKDRETGFVSSGG